MILDNFSIESLEIVSWGGLAIGIILGCFVVWMSYLQFSSFNKGDFDSPLSRLADTFWRRISICGTCFFLLFAIALFEYGSLSYRAELLNLAKASMRYDQAYSGLADIGSENLPVKENKALFKNAYMVDVDPLLAISKRRRHLSVSVNEATARDLADALASFQAEVFHVHGQPGA